MNVPHARGMFSIRIWLILLVAGVALLGLRPQPSSADSNEQIFVSIGDSIASGEGAPDIPWNPSPGIPAQWLGWASSDSTYATPATCHRSDNSGPAQAYYNKIKPQRPNSVFVSVACSGAGIYDGLYQAQHNSDGTVKVATPQLDQVKYWMDTNRPGRRIDALFVSVGANDINFGTIVERCMNPLNPFDDCTKDSVFIDTYVTKPLAALDARLDLLASAIQYKLNPVKVYITEYHDPVWKTSSKVCNGEPFGDLLAGVSGTEALWASQNVLTPLNTKIQQAATRNATHGWQFVGGIASAFKKGHGYCASSAWVNTAGASLLTQGDLQGSVHPNATGYLAFRDRIADAFLKTTLTPAAPKLSLIAPTYNSVQLNWEDHSLFLQTRNEVQVSVSGTVTTVTLPANSTSWTQSVLVSGLTYAYQVRGCTSSGCADWSNQVTYTVPQPPPPPVIPNAPTNLKVTATPNGSGYKYTLSWTDNSTNETSFVIRYQEEGTTTWTALPALGANTTQYVLGSPFQLYHAYYLYVQACNDAGCSAPSNTVWVEFDVVG